MFVSHPLDLAHNFFHFTTCPLDGGVTVAFHLPTLHVAIHLVVPPLLLLCVVAQLAYIMLDFCLIDQLQPTRLAHSIFFVALLAEVAPAPITTTPSSLFKITHGQFVGGRLRSGGGDRQGERGGGVLHYELTTSAAEHSQTTSRLQGPDFPKHNEDILPPYSSTQEEEWQYCRERLMKLVVPTGNETTGSKQFLD
jgi:hypothetical protein